MGMVGVVGGGGRWWRWFWLAAGLVALAPADAGALPVLRLFLDGDVDSLGSGGAAVFRDAQAEALRLERPALLARQERPAVRFSFENEEILHIRGGSYAGTEAFDRKLRITALLPLQPYFSGFPATLFVGVRRETGRIHLQSQREGTLFDSEEARDSIEMGLAAALPWGISLAGSVGGDGQGGPSWLLEARYRPTPLVETWYRMRSDSWDYRVTVPDGVSRKLQSPALRYRIDDTQRASELGAELGSREIAWATGGIVAEGMNDFWVEAGGRPLPWLALRIGADRDIYRFDDSMQADGTGTIARMDLGVRHFRLFGGIDAALGRDSFFARYVQSELSGASRGEEVGTAATRAFLQVDYDMGLFFRGGYRMEGHQLALGWDRQTDEGVGFAVGAQFLRMILHPADFSLRSDALQRALAAEESQPARADLLGLTGALYVPVGRFRLAAALGQFFPLSAEQERLDVPRPRPEPQPQPGTGRPIPDAGPYDWLIGNVGKALDQLGKYGGGNRLLFEISTTL